MLNLNVENKVKDREISHFTKDEMFVFDRRNKRFSLVFPFVDNYDTDGMSLNVSKNIEDTDTLDDEIVDFLESEVFNLLKIEKKLTL